MPWKTKDATRHTRKASSKKKRQVWRDVANETLQRTGDEGRAVREANAVVGRIKRTPAKARSFREYRRLRGAAK